MTAFKFRLDRVLHLRNTQLHTEEFHLETLVRQRGEMQAQIDAADLSLVRERESIESAAFSHRPQLLTFDHYKKRAAIERLEALRKLAVQDEAVEKQRTVIIEARRGILLLEKLREKRRADWHIEANKELESLASDFSAAQWARAQRENG